MTTLAQTPTTANTLPIIDIHLPDAVSWWPLAIGWWLLITLIIVIVIAIIWAIKKHRKKWAYRKVAIKALQQCHQSNHSHDQQKTLHTMCELLKRTAITAYPDINIAALQGEDWRHFLNQQTADDYFTTEFANIFEQQLYQKSNHTNLDRFYYACEQWINTHASRHRQEGNNNV